MTLERQTRIANVIDSVSAQANYDNSVKAILANKFILAWILKCCVDEFTSFEINQIVSCIQETPNVSTKAVHRNEVDKVISDGNEEIIGDNSEDSSVTETRITYDLRFTAIVPNTNGKAVELLINIEAQKTKPAYQLEKRVIYYMSRLISGQYGTVFHHSEYNKIKKVYSIWFCVDVPDYMENTISKIDLNQKIVYGNPRLNQNAVDLMQGVIVSLGEPTKKIDNDILNLMNTLLSNSSIAAEKKRVLSEDYKIAMTEEMESEVAEMCNLSESVLEKGEARGEMKHAIETAKKMLADNLPVEKVAEYSGLSLSKVVELKKGLAA